jgi:hypothetical protein
LLTAAFTAAGTGAGYWAGRRAGQGAAPTVRAPVRAPHVEGAVNPAAPPALQPPAGAELHPRVTPLVQAPPRADPGRHRSVATPPATPAESLAAEVRALRNVERALRGGNPGLAAAFLDDLDREVPDGQMREERTALRTIASCTAGSQPFGVNLAEEFADAYPFSAYRARVQQACGTDSSPSGDQGSRR